MNHARLSVVIVTWNSMRFIYDCLNSLEKQSYTHYTTMVIDNGSSDDTIQYIRENYPAIFILQNFKNTGFAYANNQGIKISKSEYILILNPDVILEDDFLQHIIEFADLHPEGGSFCGKIMKAAFTSIDPETPGKGLQTPTLTHSIDTVGLEIFKNRKIVNRGEGIDAKNFFQNEERIFGVSGCCAVYRKKALEDAKILNEYFDENFFAYKEDVDMSWRLRLLGWEAWFYPKARGYHYRGLAGSQEKSTKKIMKSREKVSKMIRSLSFRNHFLTLIKNDILQNILVHFFPFLRQELKIFFYALFIEPFLLKNIKSVVVLLPSTLKKRKAIMAKRKVTAKEIRAWFK